MPFDVQGARAAGYSDAEIADEVAKETKFDTAGARSAGYTDSEIINELQPPRPPATTGDRVQAAISGLPAGLANTLGLPADTGINIADIGKATLGAGYLGADYVSRKLGGNGVDIPAFIKPTRRDTVLGSSENIKKGLNSIGVDTAPVRPDDPASRYLNLATTLGSGIFFGGAYNKLGPQTAPAVGPPPRGAPPGAPPAGAGPPLPPGTPPPPAPPGSLGGPALPAPLGLNATSKATLAAGERLGMRVTPGARLGSPQLRQLEAKLESYPSTSGPFEAIKANNARVVQREFLKGIGESGDEVSSASLANAATRIGKVFDDAAANNKIAYDNDLQSGLATIERNASSELQPAEFAQIQKQLENILDKAATTGQLSGAAFQNAFSSLGRLTQNASGGVGYYAKQLREQLQDALVRSAGPKEAAKLKTARDQYRVLVTAENRVGAVKPNSGEVSPGLLANAFANSDKSGYLRGYNDSGLYDALRFATAKPFGPIVGNSGTATRLGNGGGVFDAVKSVAGNLGTRAYLNTPEPVLSAGVNSANATREILRQMLKIPPQSAAPGIIIGAQPLEDQLRGLYQ